MPNIVPLDMPAAYWREKARRAHRSGQPEEAVRLYRAALRKQGDNSTRRELAGVYADMHCFGISDRIYLENLARDVQDTDSLYGLARNRSLVGDRNSMADLLDLYLRLAPCGEQADRARDILWQMPRSAPNAPKRMRRAETLCAQAHDRMGDMKAAQQWAEKSWKRGETAACACLLGELHLRRQHPKQALRYASAACELEPKNLSCRMLLAAALQQNGLHHACHAALSEGMRLCDSAELAPLFCRCALQLGENALAVELLTKELSKHPASTDLMLLLAIALRANGRELDRAEMLLRTVAMLDEEDPVARMLLELSPEGEDGDERKSLNKVRHMLQRMQGQSGEEAHDQLLYIMRLPIPGMADLAIHAMLQTQDVLGLRMALLENNLPPRVQRVILSALQDMRSPLPCFARVEGRLCLLPQKPRLPYDEDLHVLFRTVLREVGERVPLDQMVTWIPFLWRKLPDSARKHCARSRDDVWQRAFAAYLILSGGDAAGARTYIAHAKRPQRTHRAYMQIVRRSNRPYEVY